MLDYRIYLKQIIEMIERIEGSISDDLTLEKFQSDFLLSTFRM